MDLARIPISIVLGTAGGVLCGLGLSLLFRRFHLRDSLKVLIILSISFLLVTVEDHLTGVIGFSGLLAVMSLGVTLRLRRREVAERLSAKYGKLWVAAELLLFVLVGAAVDLRYALLAGGAVVLVILGALVFRMAGVLVSVSGSRLSRKERLFTMVAYCPKATVQAAIGGVPLAMGLACGQMVLTAAVMAILITAPLGAIAIDATYRRLLKRDPVDGR